MKHKKNYTLWAVLALFVATMLIGFMPISLLQQPVSAVLQDDIDNDIDRRKLRAMVYCFTKNDVIDRGDNEFTNFDDIFIDKQFAGEQTHANKAELAIVGFDYKSDNGVITCESAISHGVGVLFNNGGTRKDVIEALTDDVYSDFSEAIPKDVILNGIDALVSAATTRAGAIELNNQVYLRQKRFWENPKKSPGTRSLVEACFNYTTEANDSDFYFEATLSSDNNRKVYFYAKSDSDVRKFMDTDDGGWVDDDGKPLVGNRPTHVGNIKIPQGIEQTQPFEEDFYPVGTDRSIFNHAAYNDNADIDGFVNCAYARDQKEWLVEKNVRLDDNGVLILTDRDIIDPENEVEINDVLQEKIAEINELIGTEEGEAIFAGCILPTYATYQESSVFNGLNIEEVEDFFVNWLASYKTAGVDPISAPWTNEEGLAMLACLSDPATGFGGEFAELIDVQAELAEIEESDTTEDAPVEDPENCKGGNGRIDNFLGFIICPFVEMVLGTIHFMETEIIIPYLAISPLESGTESPVYGLWKAVRNISYIFLVIAFMFLVFTETTSFGGEAYQIKRLAPRLVLATIGITLSYTLAGWIIDFFNILGVGIAQITAWGLAQTGETTLVTIDGGASSLMAFIGSSGALVISGLLFKGTAASYLAVAALTGILIQFAVVITITIRQVLIIALVVLSPLAMVASLLPNTEKFFKMWWSYLSKALMMYPFIVLLFAGGKIFGSILHTDAVSNSGVGSEAVTSIMGFLANVAPLVLVPFTFKFAGGALGSMYGAMRGAAGKARNGLMGSEQDPLSLRSRMRENSRKGRARTAAAGLGMATGTGLTRRGRDRSKRRTGLFGEKGAQKTGSYRFGKRRGQERAKPSRRQRAGAWADKSFGISEKNTRLNKGALSRYESMLESDADMGTLAALGGVEASGKNMEKLYGEHSLSPEDKFTHDKTTKKAKAGQEPLLAAIAGDFEAQKVLAANFGAKGGNSAAHAEKFAYSLNQRVANGQLNDKQASELWQNYAVGAKNNGGKVIGQLTDESGSKLLAWKAVKGADGQTVSAPIATALERAQADRGTQQLITTKMAEDSNFERNVSQADVETANAFLTQGNGFQEAVALANAQHKLEEAQVGGNGTEIAAAQANLNDAQNAVLAADAEPLSEIDAANLRAVATKLETTTSWRSNQDKGQIEAVEQYLKNYRAGVAAGVVAETPKRQVIDDPRQHLEDQDGG